MKILILGCSLNRESRSQTMARHAADILREMGEQPTLIDLRDVDLRICSAGSCDEGTGVDDVRQAIRQADAILVSVPIYNFSINAAAKNVVELTGRVWNGKIVAMMCSAGGRASYMSLMGFANSLMLDFRCWIVPRFVYAMGASFENGKLVDEDVIQRLEQLCRETVRAAAALARPV